MEPGWSQREEGREVRENEVVDRSAGSGGLKVRERQPDWGGDQNPGILLFCRPRSQGQKKEEGRGKGRGLCSCRRARWVRNEVRGIPALPRLPPN